MKCLILILVLLVGLLIRLNFTATVISNINYAKAAERLADAFLYKRISGPVLIPVQFQAF